VSEEVPKEKRDYVLRRTPLSRKELDGLADAEGYVSVVVPFDFYELVDTDIEGVNDLAADKIGDGLISDISYEVVGFGANNEIHVEVTAQLGDDLDDEEDQED
jgi:hypothetical protein